MAPNQATETSYVAFLSYSHSDRKAALSLQRWLERYVLPQRLRLADGRRDRANPLRPIFRDDDELVPGQNLPARIQDALERSGYLIVLCSPAAARSAWVAREIIEFSALGRGDNILAVVISGEPNAAPRGLAEELEALPPALRFQVRPTDDASATWEISDSPAEHLWVDLRQGSRGRRTAFLRIVAALLALPSLDELVQRDFRARWSRRIGAAAVALVMLGMLWFVTQLPGALAERYFDQLSRLEATEFQRGTSLGPEGEFIIPNNIAADRRYTEPYSGNYWQLEELVGGRWQAGLGSRSLWDRSLAVEKRFATLGENELGSHDLDFGPDERLRLGVMPFRISGSSRQFRIAVSRSREELDRERAAAGSILYIGGIIYLLGFGLWLGWRELRRRQG